MRGTGPLVVFENYVFSNRFVIDDHGLVTGFPVYFSAQVTYAAMAGVALHCKTQPTTCVYVRQTTQDQLVGRVNKTKHCESKCIEIVQTKERF